jgi:glycosyltransferase involved in cell wall biosynthesis
LPALLQRYSLFAMTSRIEGNSKALLEAMSCGLCPIGVDVPGIRNVIDGSNGVLVEPRADAVAQAIREILYNPDAIKRLQCNARKYVEEHCGLQSLVDTELAVYREITSSPNVTRQRQRP